MQTTSIFLALLPALALAAPQATDSAAAAATTTDSSDSSGGFSIVDPCATRAAGADQDACELTRYGFNTGAAAYLATALLENTGVSGALDAVQTQPGFAAGLLPTVTPTVDPIADPSAYASAVSAALPPAATNGAALLSLYLQQASALPSSEGAPLSSVLHQGLALQASSSKAGSPRQTAAAGVAAGVLAGVIGLTLGM